MDANSMFSGTGSKQQGAAGGASPNSGGNRRTQPLRPLTVKQLATASQVGDGAMVVDGQELGQVTICGRILEHDQDQSSAGSAKSFGYRIFDGTGVVTVRHWIDATNPADQTQLAPGNYARATGTVKMWNGKPQVTGAVRQLNLCSEMEYHYLDAVLTHQRLTKGHRNLSGTAPGAGAAAPSTTMGVGSGVNYSTMTCSEAIARVFNVSGRKDEGLSLDEIKTSLGPSFTATEVRATLTSMITEGSLFNSGNNKYTM